MHNIELKMFLNEILKDFDSFTTDEIENRGTEFENEIDDVSPTSPTQCMNSPVERPCARSLGV